MGLGLHQDWKPNTSYSHMFNSALFGPCLGVGPALLGVVLGSMKTGFRAGGSSLGPGRALPTERTILQIYRD